MGLYVERASFPRLERSAWMWGFTGPQLIWAGTGIAALLLTILSNPESLGQSARVLVTVTIPLVVFGLASIRRRALVSITAEQGVWMLRKMLGQTRWKVRPEAPIDAHDMPVPGAAGARMKVLSSAFGGGAILWDARTRWATAVVRCTSSSFALASDEAWAERAAGFSDLLAQLVTHDGVVRVATHARTVPAAAAAAADYYARTSAERGAGPGSSQWAHQAYTQVLADASSAGQSQMVARDVLVTITLDTSALRARVREAGGGHRGISLILAREVAVLGGLLEHAAAETVDWLDADEVDEVVRLAYDPAAIDLLAERRAAGLRPVPAGSAGPVRLVEHADHLVTDSAAHAVYWIAEWPRVEVEVGFLANLVCQGSYAHVLTCVMTPVPLDSALRALGQARVGVASQVRMAEKLDRHVSAEMRAEASDLEEREAELTTGGVDVRYTGYLTVSAPDAEALGVASAEAKTAATLLDLRLLRGQQASAFAAASLPIGWGLR